MPPLTQSHTEYQALEQRIQHQIDNGYEPEGYLNATNNNTLVQGIQSSQGNLRNKITYHILQIKQVFTTATNEQARQARLNEALEGQVTLATVDGFQRYGPSVGPITEHEECYPDVCYFIYQVMLKNGEAD